jgi:hypothetical protein
MKDLRVTANPGEKIRKTKRIWCYNRAELLADPPLKDPYSLCIGLRGIKFWQGPTKGSTVIKIRDQAS